jgi:hypothetical protein
MNRRGQEVIGARHLRGARGEFNAFGDSHEQLGAEFLFDLPHLPHLPRPARLARLARLARQGGPPNRTTKSC